MKKPVVVAVSGGFDPVHIGHVRMIGEAKRLGDELVVILNNDNWLADKKGKPFMSEAERKEVIEAIKGVDRVVLTDHTLGDPDRSVCRALREIKPDIFANGGDRHPDGDPVPEIEHCKEFGIKLVYNVGAGGKVQSSSWLIGKVVQKNERVQHSYLCRPVTHRDIAHIGQSYARRLANLVGDGDGCGVGVLACGDVWR